MTGRRSLKANKTYGDLEPNISMLKIYASLGFRAEELSDMEEEFEILNVRGRYYNLLTLMFRWLFASSRWCFPLR